MSRPVNQALDLQADSKPYPPLVDGYRISDVAQRTGFTPATLRYYEQIGVLDAPPRTASGYRVYDDRAVARLSFVARAKGLGLSLEEIVELTRLWDGDRCAPVQARLRHLLADRRAAVHEQIGELTAFAAQLDGVAQRLGRHTPAGPCDDDCGCTVDPATDQQPIACTLDAEEMPGRLAAWQGVAAEAAGREPIDGGVRLRFEPVAGLAARLADLAEKEQGCCAFFDFAVRVSPAGVALEVRAPEGAAELVTALVGGAA
jgi:DNA-binding transcriptional MerR regulator